jgi:vacuolar protein sorting-associated protein 13B
MDYSVSDRQIELLHQIYIHNISSLLTALTSLSSPRNSHSQSIINQSDLSMDSGVESDISTLKSLRMRVKKTEPSPPAQTVPFDWSCLTPFDLLLTAGKISFMLYSIVEKKPEIKIIDIGSGAGGFQDVKTLSIPMFVPLIPGEKNTANILPKSQKMSSSCIRPFLYAYFSQPHSLISCSQETQKAELSCFDIILKGAREDYLIEEAGRVIPEPTDYMVHWIETRPGHCDPKTGIPPSLYTLRINDMLHAPG